MSTYLTFVPSYDHRYPGHPESPERLTAVRSLLEERAITDAVDEMEPASATDEQLLSVHSQSLVERVRSFAEQGGGHLDADTYCTSSSYTLARLAAGSACQLIDKLMTSPDSNAFALVRPPGHHAEFNRVGGFCLFNNIACAARHAQMSHGLERILVIDFDVHHGNGTQDIFYDDPSVLFISLHLFLPFFYPGTGGLKEIGLGRGLGYTVNVPFGAGAGDYWYLRTFADLIWPLASNFRPEAILVSAGLDAHWIDPLAAAGLSLSGYAQMAAEIVEMASALCDGRLLFVLEGGYHLEALSFGVLNIIKALLRQVDFTDPLGPKPTPESDMSGLLEKLIELHLPNS